MIELDGSIGEGGGQILRTALVLSALTGKQLRLRNIRAKRRKPGLMRQHLACVKAVAEITAGEIKGATLNSQELFFAPGSIRGGDYHFVVGSAGSAVLIAQCVIPCLLHAKTGSRVLIEGGTHAGGAPIFEFLDRVYLPCLQRLGTNLRVKLERVGFYPAGGGRISLEIEPQGRWLRGEFYERGKLLHAGLVTVSHGIDEQIVRDELRFCRGAMQTRPGFTERIETVEAYGPGNVLFAELAYEGISELFSVCGDFGIGRRVVGERVAAMVNRYLAQDAPVGSFLADQLLLPMAIGAGGGFRSCKASCHTLTNIEVIKTFLDVDINVTEDGADLYTIEVKT
jgi:RNA 3'-terminal phosphate cyclase (ATP)